jgi:hypothetical protein
MDVVVRPGRNPVQLGLVCARHKSGRTCGHNVRMDVRGRGFPYDLRAVNEVREEVTELQGRQLRRGR